jgi:prepilin-type N-terminal cleavage/methylation domain-containing protein
LNRKSRSGFTLLELLTVMVIIVVLAVLAIGLFDQLRDRTERVNCTANLRNLYAGFQAYVVQQGHWPQCPYSLNDKEYDGWWIDQLDKFGIAENQWHCPTHLRMSAALASQDPKGKNQPKPRVIHYMPTPFDDKPTTPRRWPTQPWLIEDGDFHGDGALIVFPDGTVQSFGQFQRTGN